MHPLYFDNNATTPVRSEVFEAMRPFLEGGNYGNPSSLHSAGQRARAAVESARERVAAFLGAADASEIVFTSSGTEADNLAIIGAAFAHRGSGRHIVTSAVEHHAVLHACRYLEKEHGFQATYLPVDGAGRVAVESLRRALRPDTILVSILWANNEIGALEPINELGELCREKGILFHTDAVQAAGKIPMILKDRAVDLAAISGHKIYAPKGIGALYLRRGVRLQALLHGGSQEKNRRAGTENVAGAVALGLACALAEKERETEVPRVRALRDRLERGLLERIPLSRVNGHPTERLCNTTNMSFDCVEGESLALALDQAGFTLKDNSLPGLEASTGSACAAGQMDPSHVLKALGVPSELLHAAARFSLGRFNTEAEVDVALDIIPRVVERLRNLSPLWEEKMRAKP